MGSIAVNLYIEDVAATGQVVVWSLDLCLLQGCTLIVYRHVVRVGIIVAVCNARDDAKLLSVLLCELTAQSLGWSSQDRVLRCGLDADCRIVRALRARIPGRKECDRHLDSREVVAYIQLE